MDCFIGNPLSLFIPLIPSCVNKVNLTLTLVHISFQMSHTQHVCTRIVVINYIITMHAIFMRQSIISINWYTVIQLDVFVNCFNYTSGFMNFSVPITLIYFCNYLKIAKKYLLFHIMYIFIGNYNNNFSNYFFIIIIARSYANVIYMIVIISCRSACFGLLYQFVFSDRIVSCIPVCVWNVCLYLQYINPMAIIMHIIKHNTLNPSSEITWYINSVERWYILLIGYIMLCICMYHYIYYIRIQVHTCTRISIHNNFYNNITLMYLYYSEITKTQISIFCLKYVYEQGYHIFFYLYFKYIFSISLCYYMYYDSIHSLYTCESIIIFYFKHNWVLLTYRKFG